MNLQLKQIRKSKGMTQSELASEIGSTLRIVSSWERGETPITLEDACKVADFFDVTLDELAGRDFPAARQPSEIESLYARMDEDSRSALLTMARNSAALSGVREPSRGRAAEGAVR